MCYRINPITTKNIPNIGECATLQSFSKMASEDTINYREFEDGSAYKVEHGELYMTYDVHVDDPVWFDLTELGLQESESDEEPWIPTPSKPMYSYEVEYDGHKLRPKIYTPKWARDSDEE